MAYFGPILSPSNPFKRRLDLVEDIYLNSAGRAAAPDEVTWRQDLSNELQYSMGFFASLIKNDAFTAGTRMASAPLFRIARCE